MTIDEVKQLIQSAKSLERESERMKQEIEQRCVVTNATQEEARQAAKRARIFIRQARRQKTRRSSCGTGEYKMRDIVFRGKDKDDGKWYEGAYRQYNDTTYCFKEDYDCHPGNTHHTIIFSRPVDWGLPNRHLQAEVIPETVGQYTGLQDKNGKRVFEGDICRVVYLDKRCNSNGEHYEGEFELIEEVVFKNGTFCFETDFEGIAMYRPIGFEIYEKQKIKSFEIIGNIHDNPELLKNTNE